MKLYVLFDVVTYIEETETNKILNLRREVTWLCIYFASLDEIILNQIDVTAQFPSPAVY